MTSRSWARSVDVRRWEYTEENGVEGHWTDEGDGGSDVGAVEGDIAGSEDEFVVVVEMERDLRARLALLPPLGMAIACPAAASTCIE